MNIAFISDQYWPAMSGVTVSIDIFTREFIKMGHSVSLFVPEYPDSEKFDSQFPGTGLFRFPSWRIFFNDENRLVRRGQKKNVEKVLDRVKPDVIHVQTEFSLGKYAARYARKRNIPCIMTAHANWEELITIYAPMAHNGVARLYCRLYMRRRYRKADIIVVPSSLMEVLLTLYYIRKPIRVIPTGILKSDFEDGNHYCRDSVLKEFPRLTGKRILFYAGRLGLEKNIPFLMDVVKKLLPENNDLIFMIAGNGPAYDGLSRYAKKIGISQQVMFTGFIEREKLKYFYSIADVFIFASKVESQGLAILESMVCGTPVVAIVKMGIREVMGGDNGGFMVDDDLEMFSEKTSLLLNNPEVHQLKSKEAILHSQKWASGFYAEKLVRLYSSLISQKKASDL